MRILIDIPKEFEQHFKTDRFEDSLHRLSADAHLVAGWYEQETATMLIEAFKNSVLVPEPHGRLIDADAVIGTIRPLCEEDKYAACTFETVKRLMLEHINNAPTIIPASEGV